MLALLRQADNHKIEISKEFHQDLNWFHQFVPKFKETAFFVRNHINQEIELYACLHGLGAVWGNQVYGTNIPANYPNLNIVHLNVQYFNRT